MKKLKRFTSAFIGLSVLFTLNSTHSFADSDSTYDEHTVNSDEHLISEKQRLAEQMYEAVVSENYNLASQYRYEINQLERSFLGESINLYAEVSSAYSIPPPSSYKISNFVHYPQKEYNYCGPATAQMLLHVLNVNTDQYTLADDDHLETDSYGETIWFLDAHSTTYDCFMSRVLNSMQSSVYYIPSPFGDAVGTGLTDSQCKAYVMSATSNGHAVAICGTSYGTLPGYPSNEVGHWLASDGYYNNGDEIWIADPAKSSEVSWSDSISASYHVSASTLNNFVGWKGIVW